MQPGQESGESFPGLPVAIWTRFRKNCPASPGLLEISLEQVVQASVRADWSLAFVVVRRSDILS